jgi:L-alanine-DL-glutamate epimerase-like enolase superfamily enzyme
MLIAAGLMPHKNAKGASLPDLEVPDKVFLKSWDAIELPSLFLKPGRGRSKKVLRITATNGAFGIMPARFCQAFSSQTEQILKTNNLLEHGKLYDLMVGKNVPVNELKSADILCWDLHARMSNKPLHALLGTRRKKVLRYGDVRGKQPGFSPQKYAKQVARYLDRTKLKATKLHFPGAMRTKESVSFQTVKATLRAVRAATGPEPILAWDPYLRSAESATCSLDEAREILELMQELGYAWIEGPLPPVPEDTQLPKYVELMKTAKIRIQPEGPGPIGDGTDLATIQRWAEAGAANQFSTDVYIRDGITQVVRFLEWVKRNPRKKLTVNLHWSWLPHLHLAMAYDERVFPILEFPMSHEVPGSYFENKAYVRAPDWPGVYLIE